MVSIELLVSTTGIRSSIEDVIDSAQKFIILVSPYWSFKKYYENVGLDILVSKLKAKIDKGIPVICVWRNDFVIEDVCSRNSKYEKILRGLGYNVDNAPSNLYIRYNQYLLHSKFYMNENDIVISSMNLLESSIKNYEIGVFIKDYSDSKSFTKEIYNHIREVTSQCNLDKVLDKLLV